MSTINILTGGGSKVSATSTPAQLVFNPAARSVSVYNATGGDAYLSINSSTAELASAITANSCVTVAPGAAYTFDAAAPFVATLQYSVASAGTLYVGAH